jgi:hypothetical protein
MSIHISTGIDAKPAGAGAAKVEKTLGDLLLKYTSPEAASHAEARIASGVTMDMELFSRERGTRVLEDLHRAGLTAAIVPEE